MPLHPGILFSALLLILSLGINIVCYPEVREMLRGRESSVLEQTDSSVLEAHFDELTQQPESPPVVKVSQINKPIPLDTPLPVAAPQAKEPVRPPEKPVPNPEPFAPIRRETVTPLPSQVKEPTVEPAPKKAETGPIEKPNIESVPEKKIPEIVEKKPEPAPAKEPVKTVPVPIVPVKPEPKPAIPTPKPTDSNAKGRDALAAFAPIVPSAPPSDPGLKRNPVENLPALKDRPALPETPAPAYARNTVTPPPEKTVKPAPSPAPAKHQPPPAAETIESILQHPVIYQSPKRTVPLPPIPDSGAPQPLRLTPLVP